MARFDLSIVVAEVSGWPHAGPTLGAVARSCIGLRIEVIVVAAQRLSLPPDDATAEFRWIATSPSSLVPVRWGEGIAAASAPIVACLTTELIVAPSWAPSLLAALRDGAVGAGGAVAVGPGSTASTSGMYLLRFGRFLPRRAPVDPHAQHIAGDGAMYVRSHVLDHPDLLARGFWEVEFHRRWLAAGLRLFHDPAPHVQLQGTISLGSGIALRYHHGVQYGMSVAEGGESARIRLLALAPALPFVLTFRALRRATDSLTPVSVIVRAVAPLLMFAGAWSAGEAVGAWRAKRVVR